MQKTLLEGWNDSLIVDKDYDLLKKFQKNLDRYEKGNKKPHKEKPPKIVKFPSLFKNTSNQNMRFLFKK